jgi:hypothetical protein
MYKLFKKLRSSGTLNKLFVPECVTVYYILNCRLLSIFHRKHEGHGWAMTLPDVDFELAFGNFGKMEFVLSWNAADCPRCHLLPDTPRIE